MQNSKQKPKLVEIPTKVSKLLSQSRSILSHKANSLASIEPSTQLLEGCQLIDLDSIYSAYQLTKGKPQ